MTKTKPKQKRNTNKTDSDSDVEPTQMEELIKSIKDLQKTIGFMSEQLEDMRKENKEFKKLLKEETRERECMKSRIRQLEDIVERNEKDKIKTNIIVTGIEQKNGKEENLADVVDKMFRALNIKIEKSDVVACKRKEVNGDCPPIIVTLMSKEKKEKILEARKAAGSIKTKECGLAGRNNEIYINEQLSPHTANLFYHSRQTKKEKNYKYVWTRDGNIYIKKSDTSRKIKISNIDDLTSLQ